MFWSLANCSWESGSNLLLLNLLLTTCLGWNCRNTTALRNAVSRQKLYHFLRQLQLSSCPGKSGLALGFRTTFLSLELLTSFQRVVFCIKKKKNLLFLFFPAFYLFIFSFCYFFSVMGQMGFSLGSLFAAPALPECLGCSFSSFSKVSGVVRGLS